MSENTSDAYRKLIVKRLQNRAKELFDITEKLANNQKKNISVYSRNI